MNPEPDRSVWAPLVAAVGEPAAEAWMFMGEQPGPDGETVHCYKHRMTRAYLNLDAQGRRYRYEGMANRYVRLDEAAQVAFPVDHLPTGAT